MVNLRLIKGAITKYIRRKPIPFVISDTHFGHGNIIKLCHRPFKFINEMDKTMEYRWNCVVGKKDTVYFVGDFVKKGSIGYWITHLNGFKIFIWGNHDKYLKKTIPSKELTYKGLKFYLTHFPENAPTGYDGWVIYGHKHNNNLGLYPFIDGKRKRINVSAEVIDYTPVSLDFLISLNLPSIKYMKTIKSPIYLW